MLSIFDGLLIAGTTLQTGVVAYVRHPRWKAIALMFPIPMTLGSLSLNRPIGATHALGLLVLLVFAYAVRWLHYGLKLGIIVSIGMSVGLYSGIACALAPHVPGGNVAFAMASAIVIATAALLLLAGPALPPEPPHRTPLPPWVKVPLIAMITLSLVLVKGYLLGFFATFPMVTTMAAYESRYSLKTLCAHMPFTMLAMLGMMIVCRLTQEHIGLGPSLALGWIAFFTLFGLTLHLTRPRDVPQAGAPATVPASTLS